MFLHVNDIAFSEGGSDVLNRITFEQHRSQKIAIVGETGSGKSTLMKIIAGLAQPDAGDVFLEGVRVQGPHEKLVPGHAEIHYLSQHFELPKSLRVEQVLRYSNVLTDRKASAILTLCDISHLLNRRTDELSGGEKQRIALARILISSPKLVLLDEPFSNLDMMHKTLLQDVINRITRQLRVACILVSHDPEDTLPWADRIIVMRSGIIVQQGPPMEVYSKPGDTYVAGLFGKYNHLSNHQTLNRFNLRGTSVIIRPEQIQVSKKKGSVKGVVEDVHFHGSFFSVTVNAFGQRLYMHSPVPYAVDDKLSIIVTGYHRVQ